MDETGSVLKFGDGEYAFFLGLAQGIELERKLEVPIAVLHAQLEACLGTDRDTGEIVYLGGGGIGVVQAREIVRLGLIGGNSGVVDGEQIEVGPALAKSLVDAYCWPARPLSEAFAIAGHVLLTAIYGIRLKKKPSGGPGATTAATFSTRESSSPIAASSDSTGAPSRSAPISKRSKRTTPRTAKASERTESR